MEGSPGAAVRGLPERVVVPDITQEVDIPTLVHTVMANAISLPSDNSSCVNGYF